MNEHEYYSNSRNEEKSSKLNGHQVYTGFPNQASDCIRADLDFNEYLAPNKTATFTIKVSGTSMRDSNINHGDLIVVDRSKNPVNGSIIVAVIQNEFAVKVFYKKNGQVYLIPKVAGQKAYQVSPEDDFQIWGVVSFIIHDARIKC